MNIVRVETIHLQRYMQKTKTNGLENTAEILLKNWNNCIIHNLTANVKSKHTKPEKYSKRWRAANPDLLTEVFQACRHWGKQLDYWDREQNLMLNLFKQENSLVWYQGVTLNLLWLALTAWLAELTWIFWAWHWSELVTSTASSLAYWGLQEEAALSSAVE